MARLLWSSSSSVRHCARAAWIVAVFAMTAALAVGCGGDGKLSKTGGSEGLADAGADAESSDQDTGVLLPGRPERVETVLSTTTASAGMPVDVDCQVLDANGVQVDPEPHEPRLVYAPEESFIEEDDLALVPTVSGHATIACQYPGLSLHDDTPAELTIEAGHPHTVVTSLQTTIATAGEPVEATCEVFDAYGNRVEDAATELVVDASGNGIAVDDHTATITRAGIYTVSCTADGATEERGEALEVNPSLPAALAISKVPDLPFYDIGQVVEVAAIATDEYGNRVDDAYVGYVSNPDGEGFGHGRFRYWQEGTYVVTATVEGDTKDDQLLEDSVEIEINGRGPSIDCVSPTDGEMRHASPGSTVTFRGQVDDAQGIDQVTVNDTVVDVDSEGYFEHDVTVRFGINFVDVSATDAADNGFQQQNSGTCAFLTADNWGKEDDYMDDAVSLWIGQEAVDDSDPNDPLDSLNDILHTILNSSGLRDQLHQALLAQNPLTSGCYDYWFGCYNWEVHYRDSRIHGPNDTSLTLIPDGIALHAMIRDIEIDFEFKSSLLDASGTTYIDYVEGDLDATLALQNGKPSVTVRPNSVQVTSGYIYVDFDGTYSWIDSIISSYMQNQMRQAVEDAIEDYLKNDLNDVLDDVVGGLDVSALGSSFDVPRLDGNGSVALNFGVTFSSLSVTAARALFGLGTEFAPESIERATPSRGVAMPSGQRLMTTDPNQPIATAIHIGVLNHVLHSLWRGGLFDTTISDSAVGGSFPDGTEITLTTDLPPVAALQGSDKIVIMLGAVNMSIVYPGLFDEPVDIRVGALARSGLTVAGQQLDFHNIQLNELYFSPVGISLDSNSRDVLEGFLRNVLQNVIDASLNNALPALPLPSFEIPWSLWIYGLPAGDELGIVGPSLGGTTLHFVLKGAFGVLP